MTNDELKALCESNARSIAALSNEAREERRQRSTNTDEIDTLLGAIATTEANVQKLTAKAGYTDELFEVLRAEANADRQETRQMWNDAVTQANTDRAEAKAQANADRDEHARRFDAQQETIQRLLLAVVDLSRDNNRMRDRIDGLERAS